MATLVLLSRLTIYHSLSVWSLVDGSQEGLSTFNFKQAPYSGRRRRFRVFHILSEPQPREITQNRREKGYKYMTTFLYPGTRIIKPS